MAVTSLSKSWAEYPSKRQDAAAPGKRPGIVCTGGNVIRTQNGLVVVSAYTEVLFPRLYAATGRPELAIDPRFSRNKARVDNRTPPIEALSHAIGYMGYDEVYNLPA